MAKGTKAVLKYIGIALILVSVVMFILPYLMDTVRAGYTCPANPTWCESHPAVVDYFWNGVDIFPGQLWMYVAGMLVLGIVLFGASYAVKEK